MRSNFGIDGLTRWLASKIPLSCRGFFPQHMGGVLGILAAGFANRATYRAIIVPQRARSVKLLRQERVVGVRPHSSHFQDTSITIPLCAV